MSAELIEFYLKFSVPLLVMAVALLNLTMRWGNEQLWIVLLCSCLTYLMPSPEVKQSIKTLQAFENLPK